MCAVMSFWYSLRTNLVTALFSPVPVSIVPTCHAMHSEFKSARRMQAHHCPVKWATNKPVFLAATF